MSSLERRIRGYAKILHRHIEDDEVNFARLEAKVNLLIVMVVASGILTVFH